MGKKETVKTLEDLERKYFNKYPPSAHQFVPSGSIAFDYLLGGGLPLGKVLLMTSAPALGKSLCSMFMAAGVLNNTEGVVLYLDAERGVSQSLVDAIIPDEVKDRFILRTPVTYESVEEIVEDYMNTGKLSGVFIDSVTSLFPKCVIEEGKHPIGAKAGAESLFCLKLKVYAPMHNFIVVYVNQQRVSDIMSFIKKGPSHAGGWALQHYNDIMISMSALSFIKSKSGDRVGAQVKVSTEKNKLVGNRSVIIFLKYGCGVSNIATVISVLKYKGYIKQKVSTYDVSIEEMGIKQTIKGNLGIEEFVREHFEDVVEFLEQHGYLEEYFSAPIKDVKD